MGYSSGFPFKMDDKNAFKEKYKPVLIRSVDQFIEITKDINNTVVAGDTETTGLDFNKHEIVGFSFSTSPYNGYYVPVRHQNESDNLKEEEIFPLFFDFMYRNKWLFYYWSFDSHMLKKEGLDLERVSIIDVLFYCFNADTNIKDLKLKHCASRFLNRDYLEFTGVTKGLTFDMLSVEEAYDYACQDTAHTYALWLFLSKRLRGACKTVLDTDCKLAKYMALYYDRCLVSIDNEHMKNLSRTMRIKRDKLHSQIMPLLGRTRHNPINLNSEDQLIEALLSVGINTGKVTKTGKMAVDKETLKAMNLEVTDLLAQYSFLNKQITSYVDTLSKKSSGYINYKLSDTATARISSGASAEKNSFYLPISYQTITKPKVCLYEKIFVGNDPDDENLVLGFKFKKVEDENNIPDNGNKIIEGFDQNNNVRKAITVPNKKDYYFVQFDYSAEELRIIGGLSKDPLYLKAFKEGVDLYKTIASEMFNVPYGEVTKDQRKKAKVCVLGLNYGGSKHTIMKNAKLDEEDAENTEKKYRSAVNVLENWKKDQIQVAYSDFFVEKNYEDEINPSNCVIEKQKNAIKVPYFIRSAYGRLRFVGSWLGSPDEKQKRFGIRTVVSHRIQGTAGDVIRIVMCRLYEEVFSKYPGKVQFVGCVHDEIDTYIRKDSLWLIDKIREIMTIRPPGCDVDLTTDVEIGYSYGELYPFSSDEYNNPR